MLVESYSGFIGTKTHYIPRVNPGAMPAPITTEHRQRLGEMRDAALDEVIETRISVIKVADQRHRVADELAAACCAFYDFDLDLSTKLANVVAVNSDVKCITYALMCNREELADQMIASLRSWLHINILYLNTGKKQLSAQLAVAKIDHAIRDTKDAYMLASYAYNVPSSNAGQIIELFQLWVDGARAMLLHALTCYALTRADLTRIQHVVKMAKGSLYSMLKGIKDKENFGFSP